MPILTSIGTNEMSKNNQLLKEKLKYKSFIE
jgi:hypothetical protein